MTFIPVYEPYLDENETRNVLDALSNKAISGSFGKYIKKFENGFAQYSDSKHGISTSGGTTALHLALASLNIQENDEVLVSSFTNMATFFAVLYQRATPVPIDVESETLNLDPSHIEEKITDKTKAIIVVHLYGHPTDMDPVLKIAKEYGLFIVEDCAQAHGAEYRGKKVGSLGDVGCFSFYANKIITTGEGGMITTKDDHIAERANMLKYLAFGKDDKFMHLDIGYNYRMSNLSAAIGCAQLDKIDEIIKRKRIIADYYTEHLSDLDGFVLPCEKPYAKNVYWMYHIVLDKNITHSRDYYMEKLKNNNIESRPTFIPFTLQKTFLNRGLAKTGDCPISNGLADRGFYIPSGPLLSIDQQNIVLSSIKKISDNTNGF